MYIREQKSPFQGKKPCESFLSPLAGDKKTCGAPREDWKPAVDIIENAECFVIEMDLPGIDADRLIVETGEDFMVVRGEKKKTDERPFVAANRLERGFGAFERSISLPVAIVSEAITTTYENGVMTIHLPKKEISVPKTIKIDFIN
ncbi:MAG: Hsp20/alpha crystallin family protein [Candidatus Omnitrophota bacterium]